MGVKVENSGNVVTIRIESPIATRDGTEWADEVTRITGEIGGPVHIVAELEPAVAIPLDVFLAACHRALDLRILIASLAFVVHAPAERTLTRAAAAVIAPVYPVAYFDDVAHARAWTEERAAAKAS